MATTPVSSIALNPYPTLLPIPEAGNKAASFLSRYADQLPIPEPANREASALNLLAPVPAGVQPGGVPTQTFNQAGGLGTTLATAPSGLEATPNFPTYQPAVQMGGTSTQTGSNATVQVQATAAAQATRTTETAVVAATTTPTLAEALTTTAATTTTAGTDNLAGMLQTVYRAPLAASLFPLGGLRGEPPSREAAILDVEATNAIAALGNQANRQNFNPNQPASRATAVAAYRALARARPSPGTPEGAGTANRPVFDVVA